MWGIAVQVCGSAATRFSPLNQPMCGFAATHRVVCPFPSSVDAALRNVADVAPVRTAVAASCSGAGLAARLGLAGRAGSRLREATGSS
jgi:hypothetical protein